MMHRMSPLMASDDSGDVSLTPPSPSKTKMTKQHSSPKVSINEHNRDADNVPDGRKSQTEQRDVKQKTYSYMSPISSDEEDILEKPQRRARAKQPKRKSLNSSRQKNPKQRISIKRTRRFCELKLAVSESEPDDYGLEMSLNKRLRKMAKASPRSSDKKSRNGIIRKTKTRKQQNNKQANSNVSTDSNSKTFSDKFTKKAPTSRKVKERCRRSTKKVKRVEHTSDLENGRAKNSSTTKDKDAKDSVANKAKKRAKQFLKIKHRHSGSASPDSEEDMEEMRPAEGSSRKPRVKKKAGHPKTFPIECEICSRSIQCQSILQKHMLLHTGEKPFECDECGKKYTNRSNLRIHQLSHSGKMDYVCKECGQKFTHLSYLKRHLLRHSGKKIHICEHCGKGFIRKYHLLRHIPVHTKQAALVCDKCGMSFRRTDHLKLHLRNVHLIASNMFKAEEEKLYKCVTCKKSFYSHASVEIHKRIHTGARPYSCNVCSRQFKQSSHLYSHMSTHSSEKPHACNLCTLKFTRKGYLRQHKERVHSEAGDAQIS